MTAVTLHQDPRDGRPWHYVRQYGPDAWVVQCRGICQSAPGSRQWAERLASSRNRFERLDLTTTT